MLRHYLDELYAGDEDLDAATSRVVGAFLTKMGEQLCATTDFDDEKG